MAGVEKANTPKALPEPGLALPADAANPPPETPETRYGRNFDLALHDNVNASQYQSTKSSATIATDASSPSGVKLKYKSAAEGFASLTQIKPGDDDDEFLASEENEKAKRLIKSSLKQQDAVQKEDLAAYLQWDIDNMNACIKFPLTFLYFIFFTAAVLAHEDIANSALLQRGIKNMIEGTSFEGIHYDSGHKVMSDIAGKEDIYLFLKEAFLPTFINAEVSEDSNYRFRVLRYNHIVGGVQIQQLRRPRRPCEKEYPEIGPYGADGRTNPLMQGFYCYPWYRQSDNCFVPSGMAEEEGKTRGFCSDGFISDGAGDEGERRLLQTPGSTNASSKFLGFHPFVEDENGVSSDIYQRALKPEGVGGTGTDHPGAEAGAESDGSGKTFTVYMYEHEGLKVAQEKVDYLQKNGWIDYGTAWIGIRILIFNPDVHVFTHTSVNIWFPPSGAVIPEVVSQSFLPQPYMDNPGLIALDILWLFTLLCLLFTVFRGMYKAAANAEPGSCRKFWKIPWNWVDIFTVLGGVAIIICFLVLGELIEEAKLKVVEVRTHTPGLNEEVIGYGRLVAALHESMNRLSLLLSNFRVIICLYTIIIVAQFFEAFAAQPRLAMVTNTLAVASVDLFHFFIVWILTFVGYVVSGMLIFGRRIHGFSELKHAMNSCFLLMLGDFDWDELGAEHPATAGVWFWSFTVIIFLIILNMVMAIIMDVYTEVKVDAHDSKSIWDQFKYFGSEILGQIQHARVSPQMLMTAIKDIPDAEEITIEDLIHCVNAIGVRHMSYAQARETIDETKRRVDKNLTSGMQLHDAIQSIGWIKVAVDKTGRKLNEILEDEKEEGDAIKEALGMATEEDDEKPTFDFGPHLDEVESRMVNIEHFLNEAMQYTSYRGKDMRNRLCVIEDLLRSQRDAVMASAESSLGRMGTSSKGGGAPLYTATPSFPQRGSQVFAS